MWQRIASHGFTASLLFWTSTREVVKTDLSGLKLSVILPTHALNYCVQKWKDCIKCLGSRLFMFRTWIIRPCNPVWVCKLANSVHFIHLPKLSICLLVYLLWVSFHQVVSNQSPQHVYIHASISSSLILIKDSNDSKICIIFNWPFVWIRA